MAKNKLNRFLALESETIIERRLEGSEEPTVDVETAAEELGEVEEALDESLDVHDELSALANQVQTDADNGKLSAEALGYANALAKVHLNRVGLGGLRTGLESSYSAESVGSRIKEVWELIKRLAKQLYEKLTAFFKSIFSDAEKIEKQAEDTKEKANSSEFKKKENETNTLPRIKVKQSFAALFHKGSTTESVFNDLESGQKDITKLVKDYWPKLVTYRCELVAFLLKEAATAASSPDSYKYPETSENWNIPNFGLSETEHESDQIANMDLPLNHTFAVIRSHSGPHANTWRISPKDTQDDTSSVGMVVDCPTGGKLADFAGITILLSAYARSANKDGQKIADLAKNISAMKMPESDNPEIKKLADSLKRITENLTKESVGLSKYLQTSARAIAAFSDEVLGMFL
jgi:hypothetical protein